MKMRHKLYNCASSICRHFSKSPFAGRQCGDHGKLMHNESVCCVLVGKGRDIICVCGAVPGVPGPGGGEM